MLQDPLIPLPREFEDCRHSSPGLLIAGIDPTTAAPSVDNKAGSCPEAAIPRAASQPPQNANGNDLALETDQDRLDNAGLYSI